MLSRIEQTIPDLSQAERRVGAWVLAHPRQAVEATLAEVARACGTSQPTVIRFCRHVGLGGFRELTIRLTEALSRPVSYVHRDVNPDDTTPDAVTKVLDASIQSLIDVRVELSSMPIDAAVTLLRQARQIAFVGLGASGYVAQDACNKYFRLGIPCSVLTDAPSIIQFAAIAGPGDVLVITSYSGRWRHLARAARASRERGAEAIALTDPASKLARAVSLLLPCAPRENTSVYTPMSSRLAHLALLDAVQVSLALALDDAGVDGLHRSKTVLRDELLS